MANFEFEFFGLRLGKLLNYMRYFGSNNIEGVTESWVEAEMSWVEMDGAGWRWMKLGGGGWSWVEVGSWFSNANSKIHLVSCTNIHHDVTVFW